MVAASTLVVMGEGIHLTTFKSNLAVPVLLRVAGPSDLALLLLAVNPGKTQRACRPSGLAYDNEELDVRKTLGCTYSVEYYMAQKKDEPGFQAKTSKPNME